MEKEIGFAMTTHRSSRSARQAIKRFVADQSGATAIEYALVGVLVSIAIIPTLPTLASKLNNTFAAVATALN